MDRKKKHVMRQSRTLIFSIVFVLTVSLILTLKLCNLRGEVTAEEQYSYSVSYMPVYLDGYAIQGYFCDNKILISMDDLTRYGFTMNYNADKNILYLSMDSEIVGEPTPQVIPSTNLTAVRSTLDTRICGIKIDAYALDGYTCVSVEDLVGLNSDYNLWWGWSDYNMNGGYEPDALAFYINTFRFNVSDWAALLTDMENAVNKTEIDLYTEGKCDEAVYYGARLEPRSGVYSGIVSDGNGDPETNKLAVFDHDFGTYSAYVEFDDYQTDLKKPASYIIPEKDCILQVPWNVNDINLVLSSENDDYIETTLDNIAKYNKPTIIRFGAEMNIGNLGDSPSGYVKAFRKIADKVHEYPNFAVMWSPNDKGSLDRAFWYYYPGDEYVDWIGVSSFSKKDFLNSLLFEDSPEPVTTREAQIYFTLGDFGYTTNSLKYITNFMKENNICKPLAISEGGVVSRVSYDTTGFDERWGDTRIRNMYWYAAMRYPSLKNIVYFNHDMQTEVIGFDLKYKPDYCAVMDEAMSNGQYLMKCGEEPRFTFVKVDGRYYGTIQSIPIYGYVYQPEQYTNSVEYAIDGEVFDVKNQIPYKTEINAADLTNGTHILSVTANGEHSTDSKEYTIEKANGAVRIY